MATITSVRPVLLRLFEIIKERSFRKGRFVLTSGRESDLYFNLKPTMADPEGVYLAAKSFIEEARPLSPDYIGGMVFGATPVTGPIAAISFLEGLPLKTFFVRKAAKSHGTMQQIEGLTPNESFKGKRIVVIDDVATSGASIMEAVRLVRAEGAIVTDAIVLVDREEGAKERLAAEGIALHAIFRAREFA